MGNATPFSTVKEIAVNFKQSFIDFFPQLITAALILFIGYLTALFFKFVTIRVFRSVDKFIPSRLQTKERRAQKAIGSIIFWAIILLFLAISTEALGLKVISDWLGSIVIYVPRILAGVLIVITGVIVGILVRDTLTAFVASFSPAYAELIGKLSYWAVVVIATLVGLDQIGVNVRFITIIIGIILGAVLLGASLAFGLGATNIMSNILSSYYLQKALKIGQKVNDCPKNNTPNRLLGSSVFCLKSTWDEFINTSNHPYCDELEE